MAKTRYEGGCHCGRVRMIVRGDLATATLCNCSICTMKGIVHLIVPPEDFELVSGRDELTTYTFNTKTAQHHFCRTCGVQPFYVPRSDPDKIDVNVRCLEGVDLQCLDIPTFDGRNWEHAIEGALPWRWQASGLAPLCGKRYRIFMVSGAFAAVCWTCIALAVVTAGINIRIWRRQGDSWARVADKALQDAFVGLVLLSFLVRSRTALAIIWTAAALSLVRWVWTLRARSRAR